MSSDFYRASIGNLENLVSGVLVGIVTASIEGAGLQSVDTLSSDGG